MQISTLLSSPEKYPAHISVTVTTTNTTTTTTTSPPSCLLLDNHLYINQAMAWSIDHLRIKHILNNTKLVVMQIPTTIKKDLPQ